MHKPDDLYYHDHGDGILHCHDTKPSNDIGEQEAHEHPHHNAPHNHGLHGHNHSHAHTKAVLNRISKLIGHLESVKKMVEDGRDCSEVLIQLAAVRSALGNTAKVILKDHLEHCMTDALETGDKEIITELTAAIDKYIN